MARLLADTPLSRALRGVEHGPHPATTSLRSRQERFFASNLYPQSAPLEFPLKRTRLYPGTAWRSRGHSASLHGQRLRPVARLLQALHSDREGPRSLPRAGEAWGLLSLLPLWLLV